MSHDIERMFAEHEKKLAQLRQQRDMIMLETAKSYADVFIRKLETDKIPLKVGMAALKSLAKFSKI